ncbi:MAG TPA: ATP-binding protein, partial [Allocoleopsis sp.]
DWLIVVAIPENDFMQQINYNNQITIIMCFLTLFMSIFLGINTTNWITQVILDINQAAKNIAQGELDIKINIDRKDEIGELADSFNYMAEQLQKNFTEMRSLNDALFKSENRLNELLEALPLGVAVHNLDGSVAYVNQVAKQLLGIQEIPETEREELASVYNLYITGTNSFYPLEQLPAIRALRGEKVVIDDLSIHVNNQMTPVEARTTPIFDEQGNISYAIVAFQDISQRKQAEAILADYNQTLATQVTERTIQLEQEISEHKKTELELEKAKEKAEAANQAKSEFLANISHELRTPLNAILGYAQLMNQETSLTPEQKDNLQIINSSGKHLLAIINDVLEMAKIESGKIAVNSNIFNFHSLTKTLLDIFILNAETKGLKMILDMDKNVPEYIKTDEMKLRQVLINLLGNAIKFTYNGTVTLRVSLVAENLLNLGVEDTGIGINHDELMKIFDAFEQAKKGVKSKEGTGLGLAISQKFIHLMGGEITVESVVNQGSKFTVTLPIKLGETPINQPEKTVEQPAAQTSIPNQKLRLLLAEDNLINQKVALKMLSRLGYEADVVNNGKEALLALQEKIYDIVLMDIQMPEMDGVTATKQIIVDFTPEKRPIIIAVTANAMQEDCDLYMSIGMNDFVPKPIQLELLKSVLHRWENQLKSKN